MAGHSKWANIKHAKARQDAKRGKIFTKLIREITVAAKLGGGDISANPRLRTAVDKALTNNMTRDTIDRAIKRGAGGQDTESMSEIRYEGYGPAGVAVIVDCLTDNKNRTVGEVRHAFTKCGGNLGTDGSVAYLFKKLGIITLPPGVSEEEIMLIAIDAGADDVVTNADGSMDVMTSPEAFLEVKNALETKKITIANADITFLASTAVAITDEEAAEKMLRLTDMLEDLDDVQNVYSNADIASELIEKLA